MTEPSLAPGLLVAMPQLLDPNFRRAVILLVHHDDKGTFGVVLNRTTEITAPNLCATLEIEWCGQDGEFVDWGGPVQPQTGWVLYEEDGSVTASEEVRGLGEGIRFAGSVEVLRQVAVHPPNRFRVLLGYAGWGPGQLEAELVEGAWLVAPITSDVVFDVEASRMWDRAVRSLGIDPATLVATRGGPLAPLNAYRRVADVGDMAESHESPGPVVSRVSSLGAKLGPIISQFGGDGMLGVVLIDASSLSAIDRDYGCDVYEPVIAGLGSLVSEVLSEQLAIADLVVRGETGRDEIAVLLFREPDEIKFYRRELPALARRLADGLARHGQRIGYPYLTSAPTLPIGTGAALRNPRISAETQVRSAIEEARRNADLNAGVEARQRRARLFELVVEGNVRSVYEPIVEVATRTVFGYEALARGPEGSELHSPAVLFKTACEEDLVFQLDCLCRRSGLEGARDLPGGAKLFLNVRPTTIHDPNFRAEALQRTLEYCGLQPSDVVFEISEQESIGNFAVFRDVRDYYRKLGFQIALDDTGAGYASLEAVMELSPEYIKVDRAFVQGIDEDPARQELVRALRTVAERIGAQIIGEGLDTLEELETLGRLGIPYGQGWLFGKPTPLRSDT